MKCFNISDLVPDYLHSLALECLSDTTPRQSIKKNSSLNLGGYQLRSAAALAECPRVDVR